MCYHHYGKLYECDAEALISALNKVCICCLYADDGAEIVYIIIKVILWQELTEFKCCYGYCQSNRHFKPKSGLSHRIRIPSQMA